MSVRIIKDDETFSNKFNFDAKSNHAQVVFTVRPKAEDPRHVLECDLDFSGVSQADLVELATRSAIIELQRKWRVLAATKGSTARSINPFAKVNVKTAIVDATRSTATPATKVRNLVGKLSQAERNALIAELTGATNKSAPKGKKSA